MRPHPRRSMRRQTRAQNILQWLGAVAVFAAAVGSGVFAYSVVREQQYLVVKNVAVDGNTRVETAELLEYAQVDMGASLYRVNLDVVQRNILKHPDVAKATVARLPPDTIVINVQEHRPIATVANKQGVYVVNQEGVLFRAVFPGEDLDLPVITGIARDAFVTEPERAARQISLALKAMDAHHKAGRPPDEVGEVDVDEAFGVTMQLGIPPVEVALGMDAFGDKFTRLQVLEQHLAHKKQRMTRVFLDNARHPERLAIQLETPVLAEAPPPAKPKGH